MVNKEFQEMIDTAKYFCKRIEYSKGRNIDNTPVVKEVDGISAIITEADFNYKECVKNSNGQHSIFHYYVSFDEDIQKTSIGLHLDEDVTLSSDETEVFLEECKQLTNVHKSESELEDLLVSLFTESKIITDFKGQKYVKMSDGKSIQFSFDFYNNKCGCAYVILPSTKLDVVFFQEDKPVEETKQAMIRDKFEIMNQHLLEVLENRFR